MDRKLSSEELASQLPGLSPVNRDGHEEIMEAKSIDSTMIELCDKGYVSLFNYHLLENVIKKIGTVAENETFERYFKSFQKYCERSIFEVPQNKFDRMPEGIKFGLKVYDDIQDDLPRAASNVTSSVKDEVVRHSSETLGLSVNDTIKRLGKLAEELNLGVGHFYIVNVTRIKIIVSVSRSVAKRILPQIDTNPRVKKLIVCGPPGKPQAVEVTATSIKLLWTKPDFDIGSINKYIVSFRTAIKKVKEWATVQTIGQEETITIKDIAQIPPSFICKVCAVGDFGKGVESEESEVISLIAPGMNTTRSA